MLVKLGSTAAGLALCLALASSAGAARLAEAEFKTEIDGLLDHLEASTHGVVKWDGADRMDIRQEGDAAVADITNARITIHAQPAAPPATVAFDHIEIRRAPAPEARPGGAAGLRPGDAMVPQGRRPGERARAKQYRRAL
jgi:hypothetical protein